MKFEIKVSGARQVGKTTIMNKLLDILENEAVYRDFKYVQVLKPSLDNGIPSESVVIEITTFGESVARGVLIQQRQLSPEEFAKQYPF
jgi:hypothetical protein